MVALLLPLCRCVVLSRPESMSNGTPTTLEKAESSMSPLARISKGMGDVVGATAKATTDTFVGAGRVAANLGEEITGTAKKKKQAAIKLQSVHRGNRSREVTSNSKKGFLASLGPSSLLKLAVLLGPLVLIIAYFMAASAEPDVVVAPPRPFWKFWAK